MKKELKEHKEIEVYRIENNLKQGPYYSEWSWQVKEHITENGCPGPYNDCLEDILDELKNKDIKILYGFTSLEKLRDWFCDEKIENLKSMDYNIVKYNAKKAWEGITRTQCIFIKENESK